MYPLLALPRADATLVAAQPELHIGLPRAQADSNIDGAKRGRGSGPFLFSGTSHLFELAIEKNGNVRRRARLVSAYRNGGENP